MAFGRIPSAIPAVLFDHVRPPMSFDHNAAVATLNWGIAVRHSCRPVSSLQFYLVSTGVSPVSTLVFHHSFRSCVASRPTTIPTVLFDHVRPHEF